MKKVSDIVGTFPERESTIYMTYFSELGLAEPILKALAASDYSEPTPIQRQAIPALLEGRDLCGIAQTGTGKTAAFTLPSLHHLANNVVPVPEKGCRMLILSPTRELAAQIAENVRKYGRNLKFNVQCVFGGMPIYSQKKKLARGVDVLVATPGRLIDLIDQGAFHLNGVEIFVLDEADQMMDMGFIHSLKQIDKMLPKQRQSLFFSATMPKAIEELGRRFLNNPVRVAVTPESTTAERVDQYVTFVNQHEKNALLIHRLQNENVERALVFARTKHGADRIVRHLAGAKIRSAAIHGNKSQGQRTAAMQDFRSGEIKILVATDIAARGIDVPGVSHVFNFELPNVAEQYVHRIGRTARAGADGVAVSFCAKDERAYLRDIERLTKVKATIVELPENFRNIVENSPAPIAVKEQRGGRSLRGGGEGRGEGRGGARGERSGGGRGRPDRARGDRPERGRGDRPERGAREEFRGKSHHRADGVGRNDSGHGDWRPERMQGEGGGDRRPKLDAPRGDRSFGDRPRSDRPRSDRPRSDRPREDKPRGDRPFGDRARSDRPREDKPRGDRPFGDRARSDRPREDRPRGDRPFGDRPRSDRPRSDRPRSDRPREDRPRGDRPRGDRPDRPRSDRPREDRPRSDRPRGDRNDRPRSDKPRSDKPQAGKFNNYVKRAR
ncbi:hypothetical protein LPB140_00720 [Sphingorhabdus lutea]|uniref:DEAD-box ATP-dependent RNA helicase RhpA n=1 Tax=Sphingorhabdus lutea TaxID=1913578 RepID=A0A1L3J918_9SPHN|nr:hypothetical protein LPB140_00720 [Sphingorhabdus lutea]